jgi:hypothetical protein
LQPGCGASCGIFRTSCPGEDLSCDVTATVVIATHARLMEDTLTLFGILRASKLKKLYKQV